MRAGASRLLRGLTSNRHAGRPDRKVRAFAFGPAPVAGAERTGAVALCSAMSVDIDLFIRKLRARHEVSREEESALRSMHWVQRRFERGETMVRAGQQLEHSMLLLSGWAIRSKYAPDGARQIVEINLAGDFIDLHGFILKRLDHEISAASACEIATVPHSELRRILEELPRLARVLWFQTLVDASIHREWMLVLGKKRSRSRLAQFFCEMHARLQIVGRAQGGNFALPLSQQELADITGMTPVHANRSLKELRDAGLVTFRNGRVALHDPAGLARDARFDPDYLHIGPHDF